MITCWFYRWWKVLGEWPRGSEPGPVHRHRLSCAACRAQAVREQRVGLELSVQACRIPHTAPPFLSRRVIQMLDRTAVPKRLGVAPALRLAQLALGISVAFLALLWTADDTAPFFRRQQQSGSAEGSLLGEAASHLPLLSASTLPVADRFLQMGQDLDQPLRTELDAVIEDARTAARYVARSLLPESYP